MCIYMKKLLALCLSLALCLGSVVTVTAAEYGPYTLKEDGEYGGTAHFDAAYLTTETVMFRDPEYGGVDPEEITVLNLKPGSSIKIDGWFGANNYILVNGAYDMNASWKEFSSGPVANMFGGQPYLFLTWVNDSPVYFKMGEKAAAPAKPAAPAFSDVAANAYYAKAVKWAVENGITAGTSPTTFSPNNTCTTAQILTFLWRANGSPEPSIQNPFTDVKESDYFCKAAVWAYENGMVNGQTFGGNTPCTRSATVTYLWKLEGAPAGAPSVDFSDIHANADYAEAVRWAVYMGVTAGTSETTFSPDTTCTRGQIATFLYRTLA